MPKQRSSSPSSPSTTAPAKKPRTPAKPRRKHLPMYHVLLMNDDDHTFDYVIEMLGRLFGYPSQKGQRMAREVDVMGRCIVFTTHRELAELKRDQIQSYGSDPRSARCAGSMTARIEPA